MEDSKTNSLQNSDESNISNKSAFDLLKSKVEAILFVADTPLEAGDIRNWIGEVSLSDIRMAIRALAFEYEDRAFEIFENGNKYQIRTRIEHIGLIKKQYAGKARSLSKNALETLAIIAYRQPITRAQINALRQVDSSSIVQTLKEKELIYASGTRKEVGNPLEYKTSQKFLEVFGLSSLSELPSLRSLQMNIDDQKKAVLALNSIEEQQEDNTSASDIGYSSQEES
ncbi:SMC-Scp complex subunit ScpB [Silvanigrella paludirubra]|uniref:SMC-Scp complex subunit ScpB n=1 Tax=Silvanigrella paludirubra TaxID=2499159 RepID=A0A6N6VZN4_9BACT|nr:SMC-Scp complex subunit ScpB [Silvanigrella paludirubra]KAB8040008.1 SMC-Scp complex subunit ScpB [Silvanigrella paludirubra]